MSGASRSETTTSAPRSAARRAAVEPMPPPAPVIAMRLPSRVNGFVTGRSSGSQRAARFPSCHETRCRGWSSSDIPPQSLPDCAPSSARFDDPAPLLDYRPRFQSGSRTRLQVVGNGVGASFRVEPEARSEPRISAGAPYVIRGSVGATIRTWLRAGRASSCTPTWTRSSRPWSSSTGRSSAGRRCSLAGPGPRGRGLHRELRGAPVPRRERDADGGGAPALPARDRAPAPLRALPRGLAGGHADPRHLLAARRAPLRRRGVRRHDGVRGPLRRATRDGRSGAPPPSTRRRSSPSRSGSPPPSTWRRSRATTASPTG